ncbi:MAG: electron transfer flavoprotein subunit alpha/FixB family protein [Chitinophagaceae bacterium]|nr:MAG: electron transfer flavoprotein subunit alpha/FixB family protein [Chitinophagaceae bacterium]
MSVLIFIDHADGQVKKASLEALSYGAKVAAQLGTEAYGFVLGTVSDDLVALGKYGVSKIHQVSNEALNQLDAQVYAGATASLVESTGATVVIFPNNLVGKAVAPRVSARLKAGLVSGATGLPETGDGFVVKKAVFSGKATAKIKIDTAVKLITLNPNAYPVTEIGGSSAEIVEAGVSLQAPAIKVTRSTAATGELLLTEAEIVVSGGRGLKGPENWQLYLQG